MENLDFSCKHNVMIRNFDGSMIPMDQPWFESVKVTDGVWKVMSDGDYVYLIEGKDQALAIDTGYGCGNIREYLQNLTELPLRCAANSHDHFDHTANNGYFDLVYMAEAGKELATKPFPSFEGIRYEKNYPIRILKDGDVIDLGGDVQLEVFEIPDHAWSSLAYLDRKHRILFSGDEVGPFEPHRARRVRTSVRNMYNNMAKLMKHYDEFDILCTGGWGIISKHWVEDYYYCLKHILEKQDGTPLSGPQQPPAKQMEYDAQGRIVYNRKNGRPGDVKNKNGEWEYQKIVYCHSVAIQYDIRHMEEC